MLHSDHLDVCRNDNSCLADRTRVWEDQKQMKLLKERQEIADKELDGCTFKPALQVCHWLYNII